MGKAWAAPSSSRSVRLTRDPYEVGGRESAARGPLSATPNEAELPDCSSSGVLGQTLRLVVHFTILNHMVQYSRQTDRSFAAIADPTRRGILERLGRGDASITDLATRFDMSLTGMKKHVRILEDAGLVATRKAGRVRTCRLGQEPLDAVAAWIETYRQAVEERLDRLGEFLERTKGDET